jgi:hypothetical protein
LRAQIYRFEVKAMVAFDGQKIDVDNFYLKAVFLKFSYCFKSIMVNALQKNHCVNRLTDV